MGIGESTLEDMGLSDMRVLVTGNLGYIGTVLTPMLVNEGMDVVGLDSDLYRHCTFGADIPDVPTIISTGPRRSWVGSSRASSPSVCMCPAKRSK